MDRIQQKAIILPFLVLASLSSCGQETMPDVSFEDISFEQAVRIAFSNAGYPDEPVGSFNEYHIAVKPYSYSSNGFSVAPILPSVLDDVIWNCPAKQVNCLDDQAFWFHRSSTYRLSGENQTLTGTFYVDKYLSACSISILGQDGETINVKKEFSFLIQTPRSLHEDLSKEILRQDLDGAEPDDKRRTYPDVDFVHDPYSGGGEAPAMEVLQNSWPKGLPAFSKDRISNAGFYYPLITLSTYNGAYFNSYPQMEIIKASEPTDSGTALRELIISGVCEYSIGGEGYLGRLKKEETIKGGSMRIAFSDEESQGSGYRSWQIDFAMDKTWIVLSAASNPESGHPSHYIAIKNTEEVYKSFVPHSLMAV